MDPVPDEELPPAGTLGFRIQRYNMKVWGDLFNSRQKLALITFADKVRQAYESMLQEGYEAEYAKAVVSYLASIISRITDSISTLCWWQNSWEKEAITFARQALSMTWDYFEANTLGEKGYRWESFLEGISNLKSRHIITMVVLVG